MEQKAPTVILDFEVLDVVVFLGLERVGDGDGNQDQEPEGVGFHFG